MSKHESADLILKLYDLRREAVMRKARDWFFSFNPTGVEDIENTMMDPEVGGYLRMVLSYWDMVGAMVNQGAIDAELFNQTNGEHIGVYTKIEPFVAELRERWQTPDAFQNLEKVIMDRPDGAEQIEKNRAFMKMIQEKMAGQQAGEAAA